MPPQSIEAEEAVLGSVFRSIPRPSTASVPFLKADDFYIVKNQWVWQLASRCTSAANRSIS